MYFLKFEEDNNTKMQNIITLKLLDSVLLPTEIARASGHC